jgi:peptidoglycan hydrolase-like protein with peptidoglycan-binding domain
VTDTSEAPAPTDATDTTEPADTTDAADTTDVADTTEAGATTDAAAATTTGATTRTTAPGASEGTPTSEPTNDTAADSLPESSLPEPPEYDLTIPAICEMDVGVALTFQSADVACLEVRLAQVIIGPVPFDVDDLFDESTDLAVRQFQEANDLLVDGIVGPDTGRLLGIWPEGATEVTSTSTTTTTSG